MLQKATIETDSIPTFAKLIKEINTDPFDYLENTDPISMKNSPFVYSNYSPNENSERQYLSNENALRIDFIRQTIEEWLEQKLLNHNEYYYLLASLIESIPYVSNIAGTYGAYLKHWDKRSHKKINLVNLNVTTNYKHNECFNVDANQLIKSISGDILYIDPPYNSRQYLPNYHLLETISKYDSPEIYGKTGMRPYKEIRSKYCINKEALNEFADLIENAQFKHIIVSYSTEGIIDYGDIEKVLRNYGLSNSYKMKKIPYRRYKHISGNIDHNLHELLFYISKDI